MAGNATQVLLVTANVGSIFEDPSVMLKIWTEEFLQTVSRLDPKFIAIHCQEVGGKNYERSMKHVEYFVRLLMTSEELRLFDKVRVYLDEDFSSAENFTALGNLYFVHETVADALIWDFAAMNFVSASGKDVHSGNIEAVTTKEKAKFPQDFFPECKWSRKGFLRTRWSLNGTVFDMVNIHLFHDASNFLAMEAFPSVYCKNRRRALEHTLERFHNDAYETAPFFVFGDFNFRTDTRGVVAKLSEGLREVRLQSAKADQTKMQYQDENSEVVLSVGKKEFSHLKHQNIFTGDDGIWLKDFDLELESFSGSLFEFPITFPPSYPFEEDENGAKSYMKTRCPAWCDRVLLANTATSLVNNLSDRSCVEYGVIGPNTCMGDHKPVYLRLDLLANAGIVCCCGPAYSCCLNGLSHSPVLDTLTLPRLPSYAHEPYTPESMDSPAPSPTPGDAPPLPHKYFNARVAARLRQQTANLQGDQAGPPVPHSPPDADWTHCQSSELDHEARPRLQSPQLLITQFAPSKVADVETQADMPRGRPPDERRLGRCPQSRSAVDVKVSRPEDESETARPGRCFSDASWLRRRPDPTRVRLISGLGSASRLQSHHSSSDEDWFEEVRRGEEIPDVCALLHVEEGSEPSQEGGEVAGLAGYFHEQDAALSDLSLVSGAGGKDPSDHTPAPREKNVGCCAIL